MTKKALNWMTSTRIISIQEAVHEIDRMSLILCSDVIHHVSLMSCTRLRATSEKKPNDLVYSYASREDKYKDFSLDQYFYKVWCNKPFMRDCADEDSGRPLNRILIGKGLNCKPVYPISFDYARGMILLHKPWSFKNPAPTHTNNKQKTIDIFKQMLHNKTVPTSVITEYLRAVRYSTEIRLDKVANKGVMQGDADTDGMDADEVDQHLGFLHANQFTDGLQPAMMASQTINIGEHHDWSTTSFDGSRKYEIDPLEYTDMLRDGYSKNGSQGQEIERTEIPTKPDGSAYNIDGLSEEQKLIVLLTVDTVVKFLRNDEDYLPLRGTITGMGGCGKSLVINTIIAIVRKLTDSNSTVQVAAPSGSAAYNVKGCTLHSLLGINVQTPFASLQEAKKEDLIERLKDLLVLMVDEVSMLSSQVTYGAEDHVRECVYSGHNKQETWGGVPVVLFFGDYCQLPPTDKNGAIHGFDKYFSSTNGHSTTYRSKNSQITEREGCRILVQTMTENVFTLTKNFRTKDKDDRELLERMRVGDQTEADAERLIDLHLKNYSQAFIDRISDDPKTLYAFARRDDMKKKNDELLVKTSERQDVPIARLSCVFDSVKGRNVVPGHFYGKKILYNLDLCEGALVCLEGVNINPNAGLYVGAIGKVVEIVYDDMHTVGPNGDKMKLAHLPMYIVVDFPNFKPPQGVPVWDENNPTVSDIVISIACTL